MKTMIAIRLPADIDERLTALAKRTGRTKTYYAKKQSCGLWTILRIPTSPWSGLKSPARD